MNQLVVSKVHTIITQVEVYIQALKNILSSSLSTNDLYWSTEV